MQLKVIEARASIKDERAAQPTVTTDDTCWVCIWGAQHDEQHTCK